MKSTLSKKKNRIIIVLSISVLFLVVGVFLMSNRGSYEFRNNEMDFARFFDDPGLLYGETLTIAINEPTKTRMSLQALSQSFMRNHPGVNIEFVPLPTVAGRWSWQIHSEFLRDGLMTGNAPVLFCSAGGFLDTTDPRVNRFFADWLLLMQADPDFNEEKYFMNMLNFTIQQNSMPTWPLFAQHIFFAPNNSIPGLAEAVAELGGLSIEDLFYLHYVFADNNFFISPNFSPIFATNMSIDLFLDKESGMVNFSGSDFIDFIAQAASLTSPNMGQIPQLPPAIPIEPMRERMIWHEYLFINAPFYQFAAPTAEPLFGQPVPIVNNRREPILLGNGDLIINESASPAQQVLAWKFVKYAARAMGQDISPNSISIPTYRPAFRQHLEMDLPDIFDFMIANFGWNPILPENEMIDELYSFINFFGNKPGAANFIGMPFNIIINEVLSNFQAGLITAHEAADSLQNRLSLIMMERN